MKVFTQKRFAKELGFPSAGAATFHRFLDKAIKNGFVKVQQSGFMAHSSCHPKLVIQIKDFNPIRLINAVAEVPSWAHKEINGYKLTMNRTGYKQVLKTNDDDLLSNEWRQEWWRCEDCKKKILIGKPYVSKVIFSRRDKDGSFPVFCKCISCYLNMFEEHELANLD